MNQTLLKVIAVIFSIFMLVYVGYQTYLSLYNPYETEVVKKQHYVDSVSLNGFFVRDETIIGECKEGVISYNYKNAQKVPKNSVVATVYAKRDDLYYIKKIEALQSKKRILSEAKNQKTTKGVKLDLLTNQIRDNKISIVQCVDNNDFNNLNSISDALMLNMDKFNYYVNDKVSYDNTISSIEQQITQLQSQISPAKNNITTNVSGYFSNIVDGFETKLKPDMLSSLTISDIEKELKNQKYLSNDFIGKILPTDTWYFVSLVNKKEVESFTEGSTIKLKFNSDALKEVPVTVYKIIAQKDHDKAGVVFKSNYLNENFVTMRFEKPQAILKDYTGIVIPKDAIRVRCVTDDKGNKTEVKGVYTLLGRTVRFRPVKSIYEDKYVLISKVMNSSEYVSIYDQVIIKGKGLNDTAK